MIRTRIAQVAAVATLAAGTVLLLPSAAVAAPSAQAASAQTAPAPVANTHVVTPDSGTWG